MIAENDAAVKGSKSFLISVLLPAAAVIAAFAGVMYCGNTDLGSIIPPVAFAACYSFIFGFFGELRKKELLCAKYKPVLCVLCTIPLFMLPWMIESEWYILVLIAITAVMSSLVSFESSLVTLVGGCLYLWAFMPETMDSSAILYIVTTLMVCVVLGFADSVSRMIYSVIIFTVFFATLALVLAGLDITEALKLQNIIVCAASVLLIVILYFTGAALRKRLYGKMVSEGVDASEIPDSLYRFEVDAAREAANTAKNEAEQFKTQADKAKEEALNALNQAQEAKNKAEEARAEAENAKKEADSARNDAHSARKEAENAKREVEKANSERMSVLDEINIVKAKAETYKSLAESARSEAESAQQEIEKAKTEAEHAKVEVEIAKADAESSGAAYLRAKADIESAKEEAESAKAEASKVKEELEQAKAEARAARLETEKAKDEAVSLQQAVEQARSEAEEERKKTQAAYSEIEAVKVNAVSAGIDAEAARAEAAAAKNDAQAAREEAHTAREEAKALRDETARAKEEAELARAEKEELITRAEADREKLIATAASDREKLIAKAEADMAEAEARNKSLYESIRELSERLLKLEGENSSLKLMTGSSTYDLAAICDTNFTYIARLREESPKLYRHCLKIAKISSDAAELIGCDGEVAYAIGMYYKAPKLLGENAQEILATQYRVPKHIIQSIDNINNKESSRAMVKEVGIVMLADDIINTLNYVRAKGSSDISMDRIVGNAIKVRRDQNFLKNAGLSNDDVQLLKIFFNNLGGDHDVTV